MSERASATLFPGWLSILLVALSVILLGWSFTEYRSAKRSYEQAEEDLQESQQLGSRIAQWITKPTMASLSTQTSLEHTRQITESMRQAKIPTDSILSISPMDATRVGQSDYQQRQTQVVLKGISLSVLAMLQTALDHRSGLYLEDLVLTPSSQPIAGNGSESWDVRLTLTQLIYSPTSQ